MGDYRVSGIDYPLLDNFGRLSFDSAFHFTSSLATQIGQLEEEQIFDLFDDDRGEDSDQLAYFATEKIVAIAATLGSLTGFDVWDPTAHEEELRREANAVQRSREKGTAWHVEPRVEHNVSDTLNFRNLSGSRRLIVNFLLDRNATTDKSALSADEISVQTKFENDSRLRSHLSDLRTMGWLGGRRGERGYWLNPAALEALQSDSRETKS